MLYYLLKDKYPLCELSTKNDSEFYMCMTDKKLYEKDLLKTKACNSLSDNITYKISISALKIVSKDNLLSYILTPCNRLYDDTYTDKDFDYNKLYEYINTKLDKDDRYKFLYTKLLHNTMIMTVRTNKENKEISLNIKDTLKFIELYRNFIYQRMKNLKN